MPKIDWLGDDYARFEPRLRMGRVRRVWSTHRDREPRTDYYSSLGDLLPPLSAPLEKKRRPLHLIWGEPKREPTS